MKSDLPKVLVPVCGRPMVRYVIDALHEAGVKDILVVVGYQSDLVRSELADVEGVQFVEQTEQLGTGHAVMMCRAQLADHRGPVLILTGDSPLTQSSSLRSLLDEFANTEPACILGTATKEDPTGLGRVVRDENGRLVGIVEDKDATPQQKAITEVNMSTYVFDSQALLGALDQLTTENTQAEYYVTDCPGILRDGGQSVEAACVLQPCEALSINTVTDLAAVEEEMRKIGTG